MENLKRSLGKILLDNKNKQELKEKENTNKNMLLQSMIMKVIYMINIQQINFIT